MVLIIPQMVALRELSLINRGLDRFTHMKPNPNRIERLSRLFRLRFKCAKNVAGTMASTASAVMFSAAASQSEARNRQK